MRNKALLRAVEVMWVLFLLAMPLAAQAMQITLNVPDCPSGQSLTFSSNTLSCTGTVVGVPGNCTITANPTSSAGSPLASGTLVQLTALCATGDQPISYNWDGGVYVGNSRAVAPTANATFTVTPSNGAGSGPAFSTTVYTGSQGVPVQPPTGCSIVQSPNSTLSPVNAGTTVTLSASCTGGGAVTSWQWSNGAAGSATNVAPQATTSYSVTASNSGGSSGAISTSVQVAGGAPAPVNYCTGSDLQINASWPAAGQVRLSTSGFGNQRLAYKITVPATFNPPLNINHIGFIRIAEVPGTAVTSRDVTVSRSPCDFQSGNYMLNGIGYGDTGPAAYFTANNPTGYQSLGASFNANSGETFYVNIRNANNGAPSCPNSTCDILFDFATPNRY